MSVRTIFLRFWLEHRWQYAFLMFSILIGLTGFALIDTLIENTKRQQSIAQTQLQNQFAYELVSPTGNIAPSAYVRLSKETRLHGVAMMDEQATLTMGRTDQAIQVQVVGLDMVALLSEGDFNQTNQVDGIWVSPRVYDALDTGYELLVQDVKKDLSSMNILEGEPYQHSYVILGDIGTIAPWFERQPLSKILVLDTSLTDKDTSLIEELGLSVLDGPTQVQVQERMTRSLFINLLAASLISLVVSLALIVASMRFILHEKHKLHHKLYVLGVQKSLLKRWQSLEFGIIVFVVTAFSLLLAYGLSGPIQPMINQLINNHYYQTVTTVNSLSWLTSLKTGVLAFSVLGISVLFNQTMPRLARSNAIMLMVGLFLLGVCGVVLTQDLVFGFVLIGIWLIVCALFSIPWSQFILSFFASNRRPLWMLASAHLRHKNNHLFASVTSLMLTIALMIGLSVMLGSFRIEVTQWLDKRLTSDIYVGQLPANFNYATVKQDLLIAPDTQSVIGYKTLDFLTQSRIAQWIITDLEQSDLDGYTLLSTNTDLLSAKSGFQTGQGVWLSESFAYQNQLSVGDMLSMPSEHRFPILAVYQDYGSEQGTVLMHASAFEKAYEPFVPDTLGLKESTDHESVVKAIGGGRVYDKEFVIDVSLEIFDQTFAILNTIKALLVFIGVLGMLSAFLVLQLQQTKLRALLHTLGVTKRQFLRLSMIQMGMISALSYLIALVAGTVVGYFLLSLVHKRAFGWSIDMHLPVGEYLMIGGIVMCLMIASGYACAYLVQKRAYGALAHE